MGAGVGPGRRSVGVVEWVWGFLSVDGVDVDVVGKGGGWGVWGVLPVGWGGVLVLGAFGGGGRGARCLRAFPWP